MSWFSKFTLVSCEIGPNYQKKDGLIALLSLLNPFSSWYQKSQEFCQNWFCKYLNLPKDTSLFFTDNGRTSLYLLLKSLNLPKNSEVIIQPFSCAVLPNSLWQAGLVPILADVNKENYNLDLDVLEKNITQNTKAVIVQYTFGIIPDMEKLVRICQKHKLILVEDVAHSFGAIAQIQGKTHKIGTIGQASFFSFGRDKIISTTNGGFGYFNPNNWIDSEFDSQKYNLELAKNYQKLPKITSKRVFQSLIYPVITSFLIRPLYHLIIGKVILVLARKLRIIGEIYTEKEKIGTSSLETNSTYSQKLFPLLQNQLQKFEKYNTHRRKIAQIYAKNLGLKYQKSNVYMRFPVILKDSKLVYTKLRKEGILVGTWYKSLFQPNISLEKFTQKSLNLEVATMLCQKQILNLPTNIFVTEKIAEKISTIIAV